MAEHKATTLVNAPVGQVYQLFSHFNDYPKFMSHIKEVTYTDSNTSHWVADVVGHHEWNAVNDGWKENETIGWRSTDGLQNSGTVRFNASGPTTTTVEVSISYDPPAGVLGDLGEALGAGAAFEHALQSDLDRFAEMVRQSPPGALDPTSSTYLFNPDSAASKGTTTPAQDATMTGDNTAREEAVTAAERGYYEDEINNSDRTSASGASAENSADTTERNAW
ncbi:MAG TPA: SRPBCC family protein [Capsulimonadaceae bacterium]|jgi:ribosome-associated toxin RatA of RatAB toxin-antitoxin module